MGNRAVITAAPFNKNNIGVYVHWNGGQESVEGFLAACKQFGYRDPTSDTSYGMARLTQAVGLFFGADESTSLGVGRCCELDCDNGDNGTWLLGPGWKIVGRKYGSYREVTAAQLALARVIADRIIHITKSAAEAAEAFDRHAVQA